VILCEDLQAQVFIRRALLRRGVESRRIRLVDLPSGSGAGEQYVRKQYPGEVEAHRSQVTHMAAALVVHIDADPGYTVAERHRQLAEALAEGGLAPRQPEERIGHLVPKRNMETWIHFYLDRAQVDEETEYAKYPSNESACWPAAERFSDEAAQRRAPEGAPPSLVQGLAEFWRVQ
jgi:hypothetical protein